MILQQQVEDQFSRNFQLLTYLHESKAGSRKSKHGNGIYCPKVDQKTIYRMSNMQKSMPNKKQSGASKVVNVTDIFNEDT